MTSTTREQEQCLHGLVQTPCQGVLVLSCAVGRQDRFNSCVAGAAHWVSLAGEDREWQSHVACTWALTCNIDSENECWQLRAPQLFVELSVEHASATLGRHMPPSSVKFDLQPDAVLEACLENWTNWVAVNPTNQQINALCIVAVHSSVPEQAPSLRGRTLSTG